MKNTSGKATVRDYSKPIMPDFRGRNGFRAYVEIVTTPPTKYDAKAAAARAAENLRRQGIEP